MNVYRLYLANVRRQKVSGTWHVPANTVQEAMKMIRDANPHYAWLDLELVEEV